MASREEVIKVWKAWDDYKDRAEQHDFMTIFLYDTKLTPFYNDLMKNWDEGHAETFIKVMTNSVFKELGIKV